MATLDFSNIVVANLPAAQRKLGITAAGVSMLTDASNADVAACKAALDIPVMTVNPYVFTNSVPLRTIDVGTATLTDALNAIAAIVVDLKASGIFPP